MDGPTDNERLDYLYREYVRLGELSDAYARSSFDDFRLLAAVGFLLAWPPISEGVFTSNQHVVLIIGFVAIACVVIIIAIRDLLKQSIILFFLCQAGIVGTELRENLGPPETKAFRLAEAWESWDRQHYQPILLRFYMLFIALLLIFPNVVMIVLTDPWNTAIYTPIVLALTAIFGRTARHMPVGLAGGTALR